MITGLLDSLLPGLPGSKPAGPAEVPAERSLARTPAIEQDLGRDRVSVSPLAREASARDAVARDAANGEDGGAVAASGRDVPLEGLMHRALAHMRNDLAKLLKGFGFAAQEVQGFARSFVEPALQALKDGVDFSAELSFSAFSQETRETSSSFSQSTALVAQSLEIEVNRTTGEVSVTFVSLSYREEVRVIDLSAAAPLLSIAPGQGVAVPDRDEAAEEELSPLEEAIQAAAENLTEQAGTFRSQLALESLEFFRNAAGEDIARLRLNAAVAPEAVAAKQGNPEDAVPETQGVDVAV